MVNLRDQIAMGDLSYGHLKSFEEATMQQFISDCWSHGIWIHETFSITTEYLHLEVNRGEEKYAIRVPYWALYRQTLWEFLEKLREVLAHLFKIKEWQKK